MTIQFTQEGLQIDTLDQIFQRFVDEYKDIYGDDISVDQDDPDGQRIGISAKAESDVQQFCQWLYSSFDPDFATGVMLTVIGKFTGISPRFATRSQWDLTVNAPESLTLPADYTIKDDIGQEWFLTDEVDLVAGPNPVTFQAVKFGAITGLVGSEFEQVTIVPGVTIDDATTEALVGQDEETPEEFRLRRARSLQRPAYSTTGSLFAKLADLPGVTDLQVYENYSTTFDPVLDLTDSSIWCVVEGGEIDDIIEIIAKEKTGGTGLKGQVVGSYTEQRVRPDGSTFNVTNQYKFDRPEYVDLYVRCNAKRKIAGQAVDTDAIAKAISEYRLLIGEQLQAGFLYEPAYKAGNNFILYDMEISDDGVTYTDQSLSAGFGGKFQLDVANITVTEVV